MKIINDFKKFVFRGNLVDMAIGFTVGAAFTTVAKSLVSDVIMPCVGVLLGSSDFADKFIVLKSGAETPPPYVTLEAAQTAGAVTINYGLFINSVIALLLVALVMFILVRVYNKAEDSLEDRFGDAPKPGEPTDKKCDFCRTTIPVKATRCPNCTSQLEAPEPAA